MGFKRICHGSKLPDNGIDCGTVVVPQDASFLLNIGIGLPYAQSDRDMQTVTSRLGNLLK